ncbi:MAG: hypothetical protein LBP25_02240 [Tannerellaceae bacterium]|nr:hypothetical protein [Tannerellaceae bacterium]
MSVIGWPGKKPEPDYPAYFLTIGATLIAILLLRYIRIRRLKQNKQWEKEKGEKV